MLIKDLPNKPLQTLLLNRYGYTEYDEAPDPLELIVALSYKVIDLGECLGRTQQNINDALYDTAHS